MGWSFSIVIIFIIIAVVLSSISKIMSTKESTQNKVQPSAASGGVDLYEETKKKMAIKKEASRNATNNSHEHTSAMGKVRKERAYVEDSMGEFQSEGCAEHYYDRIIAIPEPPKERKVNMELARMIVMGEVLNNPGFKKHRRK
jgi:hypothetical protein